MSGLVAVFCREGDVPEDRFEESLASLDYRVHDGRDRWHGDGVALGHQHFWTTPQAVGQRQPVSIGGVTLAFAGRLDDRERLSAALPAGTALADTSDAVLVAHAYHEWGPDCLARAVGAFAAAIWDAGHRRLVLARDKTGLRHLFFAVADGTVVAASDASAVRSHPAVDAGVDESVLSAYLREEHAGDEAAFYDGVRRLPPGTRLVVDRTGHRTDRYWHPADVPDRRGASTAELRSGLREALRQAIADRLRSRDAPALSMSGGVDSTTLAGVAAADLDRRLPAYSMVFESVADDRLAGDERDRLHDVAAAHDLPLNEVVVDEARPLADPGSYETVAAECPCFDTVQPATDRLHDRVRADDRRVVFTGHGGNVLDGTRFAYADLLRRGRLLALSRCARRDPLPTRWLLTWYGLAPNVPGLVARVTDDGGGPPDWLGPALRGREAAERTAPDRFGSIERRRRYRTTTGYRRDHRFHVARRRALRAGLDVRQPYLDARVVELAYALAPHVLLSDGTRKSFFRETFGDVLPSSVRSIRKGRHFDAFVTAGLRQDGDELASWLSGTRLAARGYVAEGAPADLLESFLVGEGDWQLPWRLYACERWLAALEGDAEAR